jgi:hypothetical protein
MFVFETTCVHSTYELISSMVDGAKQITYRTMLKHCPDMLEFADGLGYRRRAPELTLKRDWAVSYWKSTYGGRPCYYFCWSGIEHIWVKAD